MRQMTSLVLTGELLVDHIPGEAETAVSLGIKPGLVTWSSRNNPILGPWFLC